MFLTNHSRAQLFNVSQSHCFGGSGNEEFFHASKTADGGYLLTGLSNSDDGDINQTTVYDTSNIFVVKCDSNGVKQWARTYGGNLYDKGRYGIEDSQGNFLITGTTLSMDGDVIAAHLNAEVFVMKLNPAGNIIWFRTYGGNGSESSRYIRQTSDGNFLIGAYSTSASGDLDTTHLGSHDGWIFKIDTAGDLIWSKSFGGSATDRIRWIEPTADGGFIFTGSTMSNDFDCIGNHGDHDYWIGKVDSIGNLMWSRVFGGSGPDWAYHITAAHDSTWFVSGYTQSSDGDVSGFKGNTDGWIIHIDDQGNLIKQKCLGGTNLDRLFRMIKKSDNEWMAAGFASSINFDLAGVNPSFTASFWIASLDTNLQHQWSYCTGGSLGDYAKEIFISQSDSNIILMGDSNSPNGPASSNHGGLDYLFVRLDPTAVGISDPENCTTPNIYLDNLSGQLILVSKTPVMDVSVKITDILGRTLFEKVGIDIMPPATPINCQTVAEGAKGIVMVHMSCPNQSRISKTILIK